MVAAITLATFAPTLANGFVTFDDGRNFLGNPHYRGLGWTRLRWMFTTTHMGQYIPLTWVTLGLDYLVWGMNPMGYHLTSALLHGSTAVGLYVVARRVLAIVAGRSPDSTVAVGAAVAALVFAVHPLRVESVAWATERRDVLSGLFYVLTLIAWLRYIERRPSPRWYWTAVALFACAVLSKALTVTLAVILVVLDVYPLRRLGGATGWWTGEARKVYAEKVPFAILAAGGTVLAFGALLSIGNLSPLESLGLVERVTISAFSLAFYLWKMVLPVDLSPLYPLPAVIRPADYAVSFIAVGLIAVVALLERRRAPWFAAAGAAYVVTVLPVAGLFQNGVQIAADRYTYLASLPWVIVLGGMVASGWRWLGRHGRPAQLGAAVAGLPLIIALELATVTQIGVWRNGVTLWRHAVAVDPSSAIAYTNLGAALLEVGRMDEAGEALGHAVDRLPDLPRHARANVLHALGFVRQQQGDVHSAERLFREALAVDRQHADAWNHLGVALAAQGRMEEALDAFVNALRIAPGNPDACANAHRAAIDLKRDLSSLTPCPPSRATSFLSRGRSLATDTSQTEATGSDRWRADRLT